MLEKKIWRIRGILTEKFFRQKVLKKMRKELIVDDFSIISCNCTGGRLYHDLNMKFLSPTINLYFKDKDFIKFCKKIEYYIKQDLKEVDLGENYPCGQLDDIILRGVHYNNFKEMKDKWNERSKRINFEKIYLIYIDRDGFKEEYLPEYASLKYKKVFFSHRNYTYYDFVVYMPEFKRKKQIDPITQYSRILGYRNYETHFDFVKWFNGSHVTECKRRVNYFNFKIK